MILHDRVSVTVRVLVGQDGDGNDVFEDVTTVYPGEVTPLDSSETVDPSASTVVSRYRMVLPAVTDFGDNPVDAAVSWRGSDMEVHGDVEEHTVNGRLHHYELIARKATG